MSTASSDLARSTAAMTGLTAVSRATGFVRIVVVAAVLGDTFLGNTYQSANTVPNLLFEIFAAGVLQAVLIPTLVELFDRDDADRAAHVARSILGLAGAGLGVVAAIGMVAAPLLMRALTIGVDDAAVREDQVRLGTTLLLLFLPQVLFYAGGMVATAVLNARHRFALPVFAPTVNNVVVTASYVVFWVLRDGKEPSLDLTTAEILVLGGGTTVGVVAFCALPIVAAVRSGTSLRPTFDRCDPLVRGIVRRGAWAALFLAVTQVLLAVVLVLANRVEGGVVQYQLAYTVFLLPHALFALPVMTALFPTLSRHASAGDAPAFARAVTSGLGAIVFLVVAATAALIALAEPVADAVRFAEFSETGSARVAAALRAFAPGLVGYGAFLFLARGFYARGDTRTPALVNAGLVAAGATGMVLAVAIAADDAAVTVIAAVHSGAYIAGAVTLLVVLARREALAVAGVLRTAVAVVPAAVAAGAVMWGATAVLPGASRAGAVGEVAVGGLAGLPVYLAVGAIAGGPRPSAIPDLLRGRGG